MHDIDNDLRDRFASLFRALAPPVPETPTDLVQAVRDLPEPFLTPSPWTTWMLLALTSYRERQDQLEHIVQKHVRGAVPPSRSMREREQPVTVDLTKLGKWPGILELECNIHTGNAKDFHSDLSITFGLAPETKGIFYVDVFKEITAAHPDESWTRLAELHPSSEALRFALWDLHDAGLTQGIWPGDDAPDDDVDPYAYRLSDAALWHRPFLERFLARWAETDPTSTQLWLAASIGDWLMADELAESLGTDEILKVTRPRAEYQRRERAERALRMEAQGYAGELSRCVLQDLDWTERLRPDCRTHLSSH